MCWQRLAVHRFTSSSSRQVNSWTKQQTTARAVSTPHAHRLLHFTSRQSAGVTPRFPRVLITRARAASNGSGEQDEYRAQDPNPPSVCATRSRTNGAHRPDRRLRGIDSLQYSITAVHDKHAVDVPRRKTCTRSSWSWAQRQSW